MPNYEELYYIAKNKYYDALEEKNAILKNKTGLETDKTKITNELNEKKSELKTIQTKMKLLQDVIDKCKSIINDEFPTMKKALESTSSEYKKFISSDTEVADLSSIYSGDNLSTESNLNAIVSECEQRKKELESEETTVKKDITDCNNKLSTVETKLKNSGNTLLAQSRINFRYAEMKEYQRKWLNGE